MPRAGPCPTSSRCLTYLGSEAVAQATDLLGAVFLLELLQGILDDGIDKFRGVRVLSIGALGEPLHEIEVLVSVERQRVAVEDVDDEGRVALLGQLVGHQLAVLPDANDIRDVEECDILVLLVGWWRGKIAGVLSSDLDVLAGSRAAAEEMGISIWWGFPHRRRLWQLLWLHELGKQPREAKKLVLVPLTQSHYGETLCSPANCNIQCR